ncbi:MAG: hypothetical protein LBU36_04845 [Clostridiales bacterium]|nr:hypothetical protein [Clostridiales bacterium]
MSLFFSFFLSVAFPARVYAAETRVYNIHAPLDPASSNYWYLEIGTAKLENSDPEIKVESPFLEAQIEDMGFEPELLHTTFVYTIDDGNIDDFTISVTAGNPEVFDYIERGNLVKYYSKPLKLEPSRQPSAEKKPRDDNKMNIVYLIFDEYKGEYPVESGGALINGYDYKASLDDKAAVDASIEGFKNRPAVFKTATHGQLELGEVDSVWIPSGDKRSVASLSKSYGKKYDLVIFCYPIRVDDHGKINGETAYLGYFGGFNHIVIDYDAGWTSGIMADVTLHEMFHGFEASDAKGLHDSLSDWDWGRIDTVAPTFTDFTNQDGIKKKIADYLAGRERD